MAAAGQAPRTVGFCKGAAGTNLPRKAALSDASGLLLRSYLMMGGLGQRYAVIDRQDENAACGSPGSRFAAIPRGASNGLLRGTA